MKKKHKLLTVTAIFILICFFLWLKSTPKVKLLSLNKEILRPYIWGISFDRNIIEKIPLKTENLHPLDLGRIAFFLCKDGHDNNNKNELILAKEYLDFLANFYPYVLNKDNFTIWQYPFKWGELEAGWYSGMANSAIALAFLAGYEVFGEKKYEKLAKKAINAVVLPIQKGGCALVLDQDKYWSLEYVWDEVNEKNAKFVLNGFLFSLLTIRIFAEITRNNQYLLLYTYGVNALKSLSPQFYYPDGTWTYYMLNPKTIESPHYCIYNLILYKALYNLTKDNFFIQEIEKRKKILNCNYPLIVCLNENRTYKFLFSLIGPPHPYWIDIYPIEINFLSEDGKILDKYEIKTPRDLSIPIIKRAFIFDELNKEAFKFVIYSKYGKNIFKWYEAPLKRAFKMCQSNPKKVDYDLICIYDAECSKNNQTIVIDPAKMDRPDTPNYYTNNQGRIILKPLTPIDRTAYKYFGLSLKPSRDIHSIAIEIYDIKKKSTARYYVPLKANVENFILLQWLGFPQIKMLDNIISRIDVTIYTSKYLPSEKFIINLKGIWVFENNLQVYNYFINNVFYFPEHTQKGNIY